MEIGFENRETYYVLVVPEGYPLENARRECNIWGVMAHDFNEAVERLKDQVFHTLLECINYNFYPISNPPDDRVFHILC